MMLKRNPLFGCFASAISHFRARPRTSALLLIPALIFGLSRISLAQAIPTAEKGGGVDVFGALNISDSDLFSDKDAGFTVGGEYFLKKFFFGQPGLSARYTHFYGSTVKESFVGGGGELHYHYRMLRPYITLLGGVQGLYVPSALNYSDSGNTLLIGGGVDYPVTRKVAARAEFTYGFVNITGYHNTPIGEINLNPWSINLGVVYHIK
jgi:hypothetical protein